MKSSWSGWSVPMKKTCVMLPPEVVPVRRSVEQSAARRVPGGQVMEKPSRHRPVKVQLVQSDVGAD